MMLKWQVLVLVLFSPVLLYAGEGNKRWPRGVQNRTVIDATDLTLDRLQTILDAMGPIKRKIAIGIANESPYTWEPLGVYLEYGFSAVILPEVSLKPREALLYSAREFVVSKNRAIGGMIAYYIKGTDRTLAVLFEVPGYDHNYDDNRWNVQVFTGWRKADNSLYDDLYSLYRGDDKWQNELLERGIYMKGVMTGGGSCQLEVRISDSASALKFCYTWQTIACFQLLLHFLSVW